MNKDKNTGKKNIGGGPERWKEKCKIILKMIPSRLV
jgi:hypothetical protein